MRGVLVIRFPSKLHALSEMLVCLQGIVSSYNSLLKALSPATPYLSEGGRIEGRPVRRSLGEGRSAAARAARHGQQQLKLTRCPHSLAPTLVALPSISAIPFLDSWVPGFPIRFFWSPESEIR